MVELFEGTLLLTLLPLMKPVLLHNEEKDVIISSDVIWHSFAGNSFKALVYTLSEDNLVPWLHYSFSDISLSVCVCMMLVALSMCLRVGAGIV